MSAGEAIIDSTT